MIAPAFRRSAGPGGDSQSPVLEHRLDIEPVPPFRLDLTVWALRRRAHNAIDRWDGHSYTRTLSLDDQVEMVSVAQGGSRDAPRLAVTLVGGPLDRGAEALARSALDRLLGLTTDLSGFATMAAQDPVLGELAARMRGFKPPRFPTVFEALVNAVACQQLSITVGVHLLNRLAAAHGRPVSADAERPAALPGPGELSSLEPEELGRLGFSSAKARTIVGAARAIVAGELDLDSLEPLDDDTAIERLMGLYGVGRWTAEYVMLRGLGRLHIFPGDDVGARNKLERFLDIESKLDYQRTQRVLAGWRPYAGIVYMHLLLDSLSEAGLVQA
ncbi:MAG: DNA-3-methyladenine glycosylase family protein [Solirubrobacteraceae bacterium]